MKNENIGNLALLIMIIAIVLYIGSQVLSVQQSQIYQFCENKTGVINMTGDFSSIDCDYYVNKIKNKDGRESP